MKHVAKHPESPPIANGYIVSNSLEPKLFWLFVIKNFNTYYTFFFNNYSIVIHF